MRRMIVSVVGSAALLPAMFVSLAAATPNPNSAVVQTRIFNDCSTSIVTTTNAYPASIVIQDELNCNSGFANLHNWRFSTDGVNPARFDNDSNFRFCADIVASGTGEAEFGLQISPWWSQNVDGRVNIKTTDGEIACWGGRLPFYSFTSNYGLHYVKGDPIHVEMTYLANSLTQADPATVQYDVTYNNVSYSSGPLAFDEGNPLEDPPYGLWGMLNDGRVGGHIQPLVGFGGVASTEWTNICYTNLDAPVPTKSTSWGSLKHTLGR